MTAQGVWLGILASALFILLGVLLIPYAGIQTDEALFANPIYSNTSSLASRLRQGDVPLMLISYLGALKTFLYWPILKIFGGNQWSTRLPMVLLGGLTIFIFYRLVGSFRSKAAFLAALLLATDPGFLMTGTFDWGPVAIEHFLLVTGCWSLYQFGTEPDGKRSKWYLAGGFFAFGLALWNKAIFSWALAGLASGTLVVFWPEVRRILSLRRAGLAAGAFFLGALPLLLYNVRNPLQSLSQDTVLEPEKISSKWIQVENALQGRSLFGYIVAEEWMEPAKPATSPVGRAAGWIRETTGPHPKSGFYYVLGVLLVAGLPWWWRNRAAWFSLIFMTVAWLLMASARNTGGSIHHVILLWPFPILLAAVILASLPWRPLAWVIGGGMVLMNLLVVSQYIYQFERFGAWDSFTDAIYPLAESLDGSSETIYVADWGITDSLALLTDGRLKVRLMLDELVADTPNEYQRGQLQAMLADRNALVVAHVREREFFPNVGKHLDQVTEAARVRKELVRAIGDSNGRPIFEVFRLVP